MLLFLICQGRWGLGIGATWFTERGVIPSQSPGFFCWLLFFCDCFSHKKISSAFANIYRNFYPPPKSTARLLVVTIMKETKEAKKVKQGKMKVRVGSAMTLKVGEMEEKAREGRSRRTRKEVVGCVQDVVRNNNF